MTDVTVTVPASVNIAASVGVDAVSATVATTSVSCAVNGNGVSNSLHFLVTQTETALPNSTVAGTVATLASDTDGTLAANSDAKVATQKATKTYVDTRIATRVPNLAATEPVQFVAKTGSDSNDGLSWGSAKLTVGAAFTALAALSGATGVVYVGVGTFTENGLTRPAGASLIGSGRVLTTIVLANGQNKSVIKDAAWGTTSVNDGGVIADLTINGNKSNQTATCPDTVVTSAQAISTSPATLNVVSTTDFPTSGSVWVGQNLCAYTGKTSTTLTGVTCSSSFTASVEMRVVPFAQEGHGLALQSARTTVRDVLITHCIGSGIAIQGYNSSAFPYEAKFENTRAQVCDRYDFEILPYASDGMMSNCIGWGSTKGSLFAGGNAWVYSNFHPTGSTSGAAVNAPALVRIAALYQSFENLYLDAAPYASVRLDGMSYFNGIWDVSISGWLYNPSWAASGGGAGIEFYGTPPLTTQRIRVKLDAKGRILAPITKNPVTVTVGTQNFTALPSNKLQILSATPFSPIGGTVTCSTDTLTYTGTSSVTTTLSAAVSSGATSLPVTSSTGLAASGTVTVYPNSTSTAPVASLRVTYTGISGNTLTGCSGITSDLVSGAGVAQHFLTGVSGGLLTSVADGTRVDQTTRGFATDQGEADFSSTFNYSAGPLYTFTTIRHRGDILGKPNPFVGTLTVSSGSTSGSVAHNLQGTPTYFYATPTADPQQRWWATANGSNVTVTLASAASGSSVTFNVFAWLTNA